MKTVTNWLAQATVAERIQREALSTITKDVPEAVVYWDMVFSKLDHAERSADADADAYAEKL